MGEQDLREKVARIIDPKAWRDWDRCGAFPLRTDDSLAKADLILALISSTSGGWRVVPVEATEEMLAAVRGTMVGADLISRGYWDAMIAAAPSPEFFAGNAKNGDGQIPLAEQSDPR